MVRGNLPSVKVVLGGEIAVGKTSIRKTFMGQSFGDQYLKTIGAEVSYLEVEKLNLTIWDLAGDTNFAGVRVTFYAGSKGAILIYDLTRPNTFDLLDKWLTELSRHTSSGNPVIIVGNKRDLVDDVEHSPIHEAFQTKLTDLATNWNINTEPIYTSAKTGENINHIFSLLSNKIYEIL